MEKKIIFIILLIHSLLFSQIKDEYKNAKLLRGTYTQILTQKNKSFESSGNFMIVNGYGICWITKEPKESITVMGKNSVMQIIPNGTKKVIADSNNAMFSRISNIIKSIFTNDEKSIKDSFYESIENNTIIYIPKIKELKKAIEKIEVNISNLGYIEKIKMYSSNGSTTEYLMEVLSIENNLTSKETKYFEEE